MAKILVLYHSCYGHIEQMAYAQAHLRIDVGSTPAEAVAEQIADHLQRQR